MTAVGGGLSGKRTQNRLLIAAKIRPGAEPDVARVFAESDAGPLPQALGVIERSLYVLGDLYVHLVEFDGDPDKAMALARQRPEFAEISDRLRPYISPYDPSTWRSPSDAAARLFYTWRPSA